MKLLVRILGALLATFSSICPAPTDLQKRYTSPARTVSSGEYPWIAQQVVNGSGLCTVALVTPRHVLTAAHCVQKSRHTECLEIHFRNASQPFSVKGSRLIKASSDTIYLWSPYDLAIIELQHPVNIPVPTVDLSSYSARRLRGITNLMAAGYTRSPALKEASLTWRSFSWQNYKINKYELNYPGNGESGNSGAPLFWHSGEEILVIGTHHGSAPGSYVLISYEPLYANKSFINKYIGLELSHQEAFSGSGSGEEELLLPYPDDWTPITCPQPTTAPPVIDTTTSTVSELLTTIIAPSTEPLPTTTLSTAPPDTTYNQRTAEQNSTFNDAVTENTSPEKNDSSTPSSAMSSSASLNTLFIATVLAIYFFSY